MSTRSAAAVQNFLPNLGSGVVAFRILVVAEVIAITITLSRNASLDGDAWRDLLLISAFAQLIAICSILAFKLAASPLRKLTPRISMSIAFVLLLAVTAGVTEAIVYGLYKFDLVTRWPEWHGSLLARNLIIAALIGALGLRYLMVYHRAQVEIESKRSERLQALQSRIRPHFLFNSMNSVASLIRSDPEQAERALQDLADVFRLVLADARKMVPISAETELARQYLDIEKLRLGERLTVSWSLSNVPRGALIPSLTLQPLLENSVYHGIEKSFAGGTITVQMWTEDDYLTIMISNPLPEVTNHSHRSGNRIALDNVRERLDRHFGGRATLQTIEKHGSYHVKLRIPVVLG